MMQLLHGRVPIELHCLTSEDAASCAEGLPLLLLHALGERATSWPPDFLDWNRGSVHALEFAGHGGSGRVRGGAYYPEYFLADADLALEAIGRSCVVVGKGIGAYVALLLAGSRPDSIPGAWLMEGRGLEGGGSRPPHELEVPPPPEDIEGFERFIVEASSAYLPETDPLVAQCERDCRPLDYVEDFARAANPLLFSEAVGRDTAAPEWWQTALTVNRGRRVPGDVGSVLASLAGSSVREGVRVG